MSTPKNIKGTSAGMPYPRKVLTRLAESEECKISGNYVKAVEIVEGILLEDPSCLAAVEELADNFLSLDKYEEAEKAADFALKLDEKSYIANYVKGFLELSKGRWGQAGEFLKVANQSQPNNPEILRCLGWGTFHAGKRIEGIATLDRALNLRPEDPMILCDLGVCQLHCNSFQKAVTLFEKALEIAPSNGRAQECLQAAQDFQRKFSV
ncbi:tetratricopeptide repeat protein [Candidatus Peregrinibacteria bacterium]|nr:tetratricopeptide repeat protein [Candidatus Peregrinibacteria bacterium]